MKLRRVAVLVGKAFVYGRNNLMLQFAVIVPVLLSLFLSLMAGTLFAGRARLGVADLGESQLVEALLGLDFLVLSRYESAAELQDDVSRGALDMGFVLPTGFDRALQVDSLVSLDVIIWGESLLRHRTQLGAALVREVILLSGHEVPVNINTVLLGDQPPLPWEVRLYPLVVIMTILLGGAIVPAALFVDEKEKRTLQALIATPVTMGEVLLAKGISGVIISMVMGSVILSINRAWGIQPGLLILVLFLSAIMAAVFGVILGMLVGDVNTLFTAMKSIGIFLYAPAILYMFPQVPDWVMRLFPTYYMLGPIVEISLHNASLSDLWLDLLILVAMIIVTMLIARRVINRKGAQAG